MKRVTRICSAIALLLTMLGGSPANAYEYWVQCTTPTVGPGSHNNLGTVFQVDNFTDSNTDGVPDAMSGSDDYDGTCARRVRQQEGESDNVVDQRIYQGDDHPGRESGDVSIYKGWIANYNETYSASASVNIWSYSGNFRARLKISAVDANGNQIGEESVDLCPSGVSDPSNCVKYDNGSYQTISLSMNMPPNTDKVRVNFRAHEHKTEAAYGIAAIDSLTFTRQR